MTERKTHSQTLIELSYPGDIVAYVTAARTDGDSWRTIADAVNGRLAHNVTVSWESLRSWYGGKAAS